MPKEEIGRTLCVDPGETTGWSTWTYDCSKLIGGGQTPLGQMMHDFYDAAHDGIGPLAEGESDLLRDGVAVEENVGPIKRVIIEIFALYPWKAKEMYWDEFRTVQLIGALQFIATLHDIEIVKQPASIKERAKAGGVEEFYVRPLHENRHQNDSIQHAWFYRQVEVLGRNLPAPVKA
jgi:hypothetical protein